MITALLLLSLTATPKELVGTWSMNGEPFVTFNANGTGTMEEDKVKWSAEGSTLKIVDEDGETDRVQYKVDGDTLKLVVGGVPMTLSRAGKAPSKLQKAAQRAAAANEDDDGEKDALATAQKYLAQQQGGATAVKQPSGAKAAGNDQLSQLLLSSAWCFFSYNKISGTTTNERYVFRRDGTWSSGGNRESLNSGANGSVYGSSDSAGGGRWEVRGGQLLLDGETVPIQVTQNSNGSPIINADGREFSRCN